MGRRDNDDAGRQDRDTKDLLLTVITRRALGRSQRSLPAPSAIDDTLLVRCADGLLSAAERDDLERRLVSDADARDRLGILAGGLDEAGLPHAPVTDASAVAHAAGAVSRYVFHVAGGLFELLRGGAGGTALQPAAVRGTASAAPTGFQIDREFQTAQGVVQARFELHAERADEGDGALVDLVVHVAPLGGGPIEGIRCKLLRDGRPIDSREVETVGCTFSHLGPARYDIELRKGGVEIGRVLFDLRG